MKINEPKMDGLFNTFLAGRIPKDGFIEFAMGVSAKQLQGRGSAKPVGCWCVQYVSAAQCLRDLKSENWVAHLAEVGSDFTWATKSFLTLLPRPQKT